MDERMQFVQGVWCLPQDRLQDLRSLSGMRHSGAHRPKPASVPLRASTSFSGGELHSQREARACQLGCPQDPRAANPQILRNHNSRQEHHPCGARSPWPGRAPRSCTSSCARNSSVLRAASQRAVVHRLQRRVPAGKSQILLPAYHHRPRHAESLAASLMLH
jgi:hypothetical protein